jgi:hypothetical protein
LSGPAYGHLNRRLSPFRRAGWAGVHASFHRFEVSWIPVAAGMAVEGMAVLVKITAM